MYEAPLYKTLVRRLPVLLVIAYAVWSYLPARDSILGWGGDAGDQLFNQWTFEVVWHNLKTGSLWWAPLYGGSPIGLAFSENQILPALLLWPVRALTDNGALASGVGAIIWCLLAFVCAAGWLRALGLREMAAWGGLLFSACGWLQSQYAHYQNLYVFLIPLAMWSWVRYLDDARPLRLWACALAFGWVAGWNLYFQVFVDFLLAILAYRARKPLVLLLAMAVQLPFLANYAALGRELGGYGVAVSYGAALRSLLGSAFRPRLVLPSFEMEIEGAGYLGPVWLVLMLLSWSRRESRSWLIASAISFWASLGRGYGLFDLLALLPGVSGLRATGRAQILVMMFSLPAVLGWLEHQSPKLALPILGLVILDLIPASRPARTRVDPALWGPPTPLSRRLSLSSAPLLVFPAPDSRIMLDLTQSWTPYFGGFSGREPPGESLLRLLQQRGQFAESIEFARPARVLALADRETKGLSGLNQLEAKGCLPDPELKAPCLFDVHQGLPPPLSLRHDTHWEKEAGGRWPVADLRATSTGALDIRELDRCRLLRTTHVLGLSYTRSLPLPLMDRARFGKGETILHVEARQWIYRTGMAQADFDVACEQAPTG